MQNNFDLDLERVLVLEGGYVNNPKDPGGATMKGVTQHVYDTYRLNNQLLIQSVRQITKAEITSIYRLQYANKINYDRLAAGVDGVVFDGAVNSGPRQSVLWLQRALGNVRVDGVVGESTIRAIEEFPDDDLLIAKICERRMLFLKALTTYKTFGKGWASRVAHVKVAGQTIASGSVGPTPVYFVGGEKKAFVEYAKPLPSKAIPDALSGGGIVAGGLASAQETLSGLSFIPHVDHVVSVLGAAGATALGIGVAARWIYTHRENKLIDALDLAPSAALAPAGAEIPSDPTPDAQAKA